MAKGTEQRLSALEGLVATLQEQVATLETRLNEVVDRVERHVNAGQYLPEGS